MNIFADIFTVRFARYFFTHAFACLGVMSTLMQTYGVIFPPASALQGNAVFVAVIILSFLGGIALSWPRPIKQEYSSPKTKISIVKGDLLKEEGHIVIGTNDTFDTATPNIIARTSLQAQVADRLYGGDVERLDAQIADALKATPATGAIEKPGKMVRYGIGSVAALQQGPRYLFWLAYCEMNQANEARSGANEVWISLLALWKVVSAKGNGGSVSIPVIGGGQARLSSILPAQDAIRFTILSYMFASRQSRVCDELRIVVRPDDYKKLDRLELQAFLASLRSS